MPLRGTSGQAAGRRPSGKMIRRRKLPDAKRAAREAPQRRVHALLAGILSEEKYVNYYRDDT